MAITNINLSEVEVKTTEELGAVYGEMKRNLDMLELNLIQNNYTYEYLKFFLDYLIYWEVTDDKRIEEKRVRKTLKIIDSFYAFELYRCMATEIITNRINYINIQIQKDLVAKINAKCNK